VPIAVLVEQCLAGESTSMFALVEQYQGRVFGLCYRMLGHRVDAEDVTQETFLRVFRSLHRWDANRDFLPWLFAIAGNCCRTLLAKRSHHTHFQLIDNMAIESTRSSAEGDNEHDLGEEVQLALAQLKDSHRLAFILFHEQQLSYNEIAEAMECPIGTVKTRIHRARKELARWLARRHPELARHNELQSI
jgi:RNA polymerase sigma-70 factor (ECF subfamily)